MGRNSKARRDARRRKPGPGRPPGSPSGAWQGSAPAPSPADILTLADLHVVAHVRRLGVRPDAGEAARYADWLHRSGLPPQAVARVLRGLLDRLLPPVVESWGTDGLDEAMGRLLGPGIDAHCDLDLTGSADLAVGLRIAAVLGKLPLVEHVPDTAAGDGPEPGSREATKLAQVRGLLAKAEATPYEEEAEALSAKAQELISRYSLEQLLTHASGQKGESVLISRRLWLDAPYVEAKSVLVHEVALANHCRSVFHSSIGMCTLVGAPFDVSAADLLVTSLLSQAQRAMLGHGSRIDRGGRSRTRSFRQSFLVSFAAHIGERLRCVSSDASQSSLPVLHEHDKRVDELTETMFPRLVTKTSTITNAEGWAGGRAAAELAQLDLFEAVH